MFRRNKNWKWEKINPRKIYQAEFSAVSPDSFQLSIYSSKSLPFHRDRDKHELTPSTGCPCLARSNPAGQAAPFHPEIAIAQLLMALTCQRYGQGGSAKATTKNRNILSGKCSNTISCLQLSTLSVKRVKSPPLLQAATSYTSLSYFNSGGNISFSEPKVQLKICNNFLLRRLSHRNCDTQETSSVCGHIEFHMPRKFTEVQ